MHRHKLAAYYNIIRYSRPSMEPCVEAARRACALIDNEFTTNDADTNAACAFMKMIMLEYREEIYNVLHAEQRIAMITKYNQSILRVRDIDLYDGMYVDSKRKPVNMTLAQLHLRDIVKQTNYDNPVESYAHTYMLSFDIPSNITAAVKQEMFLFANRPKHYDELKKK